MSEEHIETPNTIVPNDNSVGSQMQSPLQDSPAPSPSIEQISSRADSITVNYDWDRPLFVKTKGFRTANVSIKKATDRRWGDKIRIEAEATSMSTTLHDRLVVQSTVNELGEYSLVFNIGWSFWDLGLTNIEVTVTMPIQGSENDAPLPDIHPGIRAEVETGSIGATMIGNTKLAILDLTTMHGPAHLSDVTAEYVKLTAHSGNITVHDIHADNSVEINGHGAWMDIDNVYADTLTSSSSDAIISLKDIEANIIKATTTNARIGLGNIKANTLSATTTKGEVISENVQAIACEVKTEKGCIEGIWVMQKKLFMTTTDAKIDVKIEFTNKDDRAEVVLNTRNAPINVDLPSAYSGGFLLQTSGYYKAYIHTGQAFEAQPVLHKSQPDYKVGLIGGDGKKHSLRAITKEAPINAYFGRF